MTQKTKYAIRCSIEEQARECEKSNLETIWESNGYVLERPKMLKLISMGYTIITYEVALEKGILGEKQQYVSEPTIAKPVYQYVKSAQESPSEDNLVEKDIFMRFELVGKKVWCIDGEEPPFKGKIVAIHLDGRLIFEFDGTEENTLFVYKDLEEASCKWELPEDPDIKIIDGIKYKKID